MMPLEYDEWQGALLDAEAKAYVEAAGDPVPDIIWLNSRYEVWVYRNHVEGMHWLSIKRMDLECIHDWRDLQRIKNDLVGDEYEAVELYPAESRLVDTNNQYHLWVMADKNYRFPFGKQIRKVSEITSEHLKQRLFEKKPLDL